MTDMASKMLHALTMAQEPKENTYSESYEQISIPEQKKYLKRYVDSLDVNDRRAIGDILIMNDLKSALNWCSEGTVINMDILPDNVIEQMYNLALYKVNRK